MAIRGHQVSNPYADDLSCKMAVEAERGALVCLPTGTFTTGMDVSAKSVEVPVAPSGRKFAGILMHTVDDYDTTRIPFNYQDPYTVPVNSKVLVKREFRGKINNLHAASSGSITPGATMYVGPNGTATPLSTSGYPTAGRFESAVDSDGFVEVSVKI